jgi:CBS domain containing-hemolysin-like protein
MSPDGLRPLFTIGLLLVVSAIFSAAEISFLALRRRRSEKIASGSLGALLNRMLSRPAVTLSAILVAITAVNYSAEALATEWIVRDLHLPVWIALVGVAVILLVFSEIVPISYAAANPERVSRATILPVWLVTTILLPFTRTLGFIADLLARIFGASGSVDPPVSEGEIRAIVDIQAETGSLEEEEKVMIHQIFEFGDRMAREVLVPRTDMSALPATATATEAGLVATERRLSRLPVYRDHLDQIIGTVHVKDVIPLLAAGRGQEPVTTVMRPPMFVPETKKLSDLLEEFRLTRRTLAIVVDEYGGTAGLVTLEDLLEEVVGDIYDEYDVVKPLIEVTAEGALLDGRVSIEEASDVLGIELPEGEYDSLAGFIYAHLGSIPKLGDALELTGYRFVVESLDGHRVTWVRAVRPAEASGEAPEGGRPQ